MVVSGGAFTEALMILLGALFMAGGVARQLRVRVAFSRAEGFSASPIHRVLFFLIGLAAFVEGIRLLSS